METLDRLEILNRLPYVCVGDSMQSVEWHNKNGFHCFKSINSPGVWVPVCLFKGEWIPVERFSDGPAGFWISEGPINKFVRVKLKDGYWHPLSFFDERPLDAVRANKYVANVAIKKKTDTRVKRNTRDTKIGSSVPVKPQHIQKKHLFSETKERINDRRLCPESTGYDFQMPAEKQSVHFPELDSKQAINATNLVPNNWAKKSSILQVNKPSCLNDQLNPMETESMACEFVPESVKLYDQTEDTEIESCVQKRMDIQINSNIGLQNQTSVFAQEVEAPNKTKVGKLNPQAIAFSPKRFDHQPISESEYQESNYIQANYGSQLHSKLMITEQSPSSYEVTFGQQVETNLNVHESNEQMKIMRMEPRLGECASPSLAPSPLVKLVVQMYDGKPCYAANMCTLHSYHHKVFQVRRCPVEPILAPPLPVLDLVQWQIEERLKEKMRQGVNISPADATYMFLS